ncbi:hypothetical protein QP185_09015 [Sphingomonas aerolata]|uniref:hypothetical protein n=1 Tax=Sphingomonas aerolata TaxID=185951 RepID=UPI002FE106AC
MAPFTGFVWRKIPTAAWLLRKTALIQPDTELARGVQSRGYRQPDGPDAAITEGKPPCPRSISRSAKRILLSFAGALVFAGIAISAATPIIPIA